MNTFCIITPVFDGCCSAASLLINSLQNQSYKSFIQILISNGSSQNIKNLIDDERFIYHEYPIENTPTVSQLIENLGKRRNYCLKNYEADRYFFFDADLALIDNEFFYKINELHHKADVIVSRIKLENWELPVLPIRKGCIDIANYSISNNMAKKYNYPTQYDKAYDIAFDWRFFSQFKDESLLFSDILFAIKNGNNHYKTVSQMFTKKWFPFDTCSYTNT